jgi:hypothetical protein
LLKTGFAIADFQVLDLVMHVITDGERGFAYIDADDRQGQLGSHSGQLEVDEKNEKDFQGIFCYPDTGSQASWNCSK